MKKLFEKMQKGEQITLFGTNYKRVGNITQSIQSTPNYNKFGKTYWRFIYNISLNLIQKWTHNGSSLQEIFEKDVKILHIEKFRETIKRTVKSINNPVEDSFEEKNYYLKVKTNKNSYYVKMKNYISLNEMAKFIKTYIKDMENIGK